MAEEAVVGPARAREHRPVEAELTSPSWPPCVWPDSVRSASPWGTCRKPQRIVQQEQAEMPRAAREARQQPWMCSRRPLPTQSAPTSCTGPTAVSTTASSSTSSVTPSRRARGGPRFGLVVVVAEDREAAPGQRRSGASALASAPGRAGALHGEEVAREEHQIGLVRDQASIDPPQARTGCQDPRCGSAICTTRSGRPPAAPARRRGSARPACA